MALGKLVTVCGLLTIALLLPPAARADQFTQELTDSNPNFDTVGAGQLNFNLFQPSNNFTRFDPSLGTLTSVQFSFTLEPITSWVTNPGNNAPLSFFSSIGAVVVASPFDLAPGFYMSSITITNSTPPHPINLPPSLFIGTGFLPLHLSAITEPLNTTDTGSFTSAFLVADLTYTFTPAAAVPGPIVGAGLPGLLGLLGLGGFKFWRRRKVA